MRIHLKRIERAKIDNGLHHMHHLAHVSYLGLVSIEAHGFYSSAALVLGGCVVILWCRGK